MPAPRQVESGAYSLAGTIESDPHIYRMVGDLKVYLMLDPKWVTTDTAFANFRPQGGLGTWAGLGLLRDVTDRDVVVTPFVLGLPTPDWHEVGGSSEHAASVGSSDKQV